MPRCSVRVTRTQTVTSVACKVYAPPDATTRIWTAPAAASPVLPAMTEKIARVCCVSRRPKILGSSSAASHATRRTVCFAKALFQSARPRLARLVRAPARTMARRRECKVPSASQAATAAPAFAIQTEASASSSAMQPANAQRASSAEPLAINRHADCRSRAAAVSREATLP